MDTPVLYLIWAVALVVATATALAWGLRGLRGLQQEILDAIIKADSEEEKAEIERKVIKAVYPPRFNRD